MVEIKTTSFSFFLFVSLPSSFLIFSISSLPFLFSSFWKEMKPVSFLYRFWEQDTNVRVDDSVVVVSIFSRILPFWLVTVVVQVVTSLSFEVFGPER
jgi:hypothetical protein